MRELLRTKPDTGDGISRNTRIVSQVVNAPRVPFGIARTAERSFGMLEQYDDLLTAEEACEVLKMGKNALYALLGSGELKAFRNGRVWRIPKQSVIEFICGKSKLTSF